MATTDASSESVEVGAGPVFNYLGGAALILVSGGAITWGGATAVGDTAGEIGSGVFLLLALALLILAVVGRRNVRLVANEALVVCVGLFGRTRVCPRGDLTEVRVIWHTYTGKGMGMWVFPTLLFLSRNLTESIATPAILYRSDDLQRLADYLGQPINLERPPGPA